MLLGTSRPTYITVIGAGAIGSFFAARFTRAGYAVGVVARGSRLQSIRRLGGLIKADSPLAVGVLAEPTFSALPAPYLVILCTKTQDLDEVLSQLKPHASPNLGVVTVQNGGEAPELVAVKLPSVQVLAGRVHGFFELHGDVVRHLGVEPSLAFGTLEGLPSPAAELLATCLQSARIGFTRPEDMRRSLWEKFLLASSIGGVGAALAALTEYDFTYKGHLEK